MQQQQTQHPFPSWTDESVRERVASPSPHVTVVPNPHVVSVVEPPTPAPTRQRPCQCCNRTLCAIWTTLAIVVASMAAFVALGDGIKVGGFQKNGNSGTFALPASCQPTLSNDTRPALVTEFINSIKLSTKTLSTPNAIQNKASSLEELALLWLVQCDPLQLLPDSDVNKFRLQQRYALLTLHLSHPNALNVSSTTNVSEHDECNWPMVQSCSDNDSSSTDDTFDAWGTTTSPSSSPFIFSNSSNSTNMSNVTTADNNSTSIANSTTTDPASTLSQQRVVTEIQHPYFLDAVTPRSTLSPDLGLLINLTRFDLLSFDLGRSGSIPESFNQWTDLTYFSTAGCGLTGSLPASIGTAWSNLYYFSISYNNITGSIPSTVAAWTSLYDFEVLVNKLTGPIPTAIGLAWTNLNDFDVRENDLTGTIPSSLNQWTFISTAHFEFNRLKGNVPATFCQINDGSEDDDYLYSGGDLWADCDEVKCPCCTHCCSEETLCREQ